MFWHVLTRVLAKPSGLLKSPEQRGGASLHFAHIDNVESAVFAVFVVV